MRQKVWTSFKVWLCLVKQDFWKSLIKLSGGNDGRPDILKLIPFIQISWCIAILSFLVKIWIIYFLQIQLGSSYTANFKQLFTYLAAPSLT